MPGLILCLFFSTVGRANHSRAATRTPSDTVGAQPWGLGFGVKGQGLGLRTWGLGFRIQDLEFRVWVQGLRFRVVGLRGKGLAFKV